MRFLARPPLALAGLLLVGSCVSNDTTGAGDIASPAGIFVQPAVIPSAADASALPINRIRAVTARWPDNVVLDDTTFVVDPVAPEWTLDISVRLLESPVKARVFLRLIHDDGAGGQETQYSGRTDTLTVARGATVEAADMPLVRGPLANLFVTDVTITSAPSTMAEEASALLEATVATSGTTTPTPFWTSLDETVVTMDEATVTAVGPGEVPVVASAGAFADTVSIQVFAALSLDVLSLPGGVQGTGYDEPLAASGGDGLYTWSVSTGALPAGTSLDADRIVGTPTTVERAAFTLQVASGDGQTATRDLTIEIQDDAPPGFTVTESSGSSAVDEGGTTDDVAVVLTAQPIDDVVLSVASGDAGEVLVEPTTLTFTNTDWSTAQTLTLTGVDDAEVDGDQTTSVTIAVDAGASDDRFDGLDAQSVDVVTADDDESGGGGALARWASAASGNWSEPANWVGGEIPQPGDSVVIDAAGSSYTVTLDVSADVEHLLVGGGVGAPVDFVQNGNTLTVGSSVTVLGGSSFTLGGTGVLNGSHTGELRAFTWTGGEYGGTGTTTLLGSGHDLSGSGHSLNGRTLRNEGDASWTGGSFTPSNSSTFINAAGATWTIAGGVSYGFATGASVVNEGTIVHDNASGFVIFGVALDNNGLVQVVSGDFEVNGNGTHSGDFVVEAGGRLVVDSGVHDFQGSITGAGDMLWSGGVSTVSGAYELAAIVNDQPPVSFQGFITSPLDSVVHSGPNSMSFNTGSPVEATLWRLSNGGLAGSDTLVVLDSLTWTGGDLSLATGGAMAVRPGAGARISNPGLLRGDFHNAGETTWAAGNLETRNSAVLRNVAGGTLNVVGDFSLLGDGTTTMENAGQLTKSAGTGAWVVEIPVVNSGIMDVSSGILDPQDAFTHAAGGVLRGTGTVDLADVTTLDLSGDVEPGSSPGILTMVGPVAQEATSAFTFEVAGTTPGSGHDQLIANGAIDLSGDLVVLDTTAFTPSDGDRYAIMTFNSRTGTFANVTLPDLSASGITLDTVWAEAGTADTLYIEASGGGLGAPLVQWTNTLGGLWSSGANWSTGSPPAPGDSAVIDLDGTYTVELDVDAEVASLVIDAASGVQTLSQQANTVTLSGSGLIGGTGSYELSGTGTLTGAGRLTVDGLTEWLGGTMSGTGQTAVGDAGTLFISGTAVKTLNGRDLEIAGGAVWLGTGNIEHDGSPIITVTSTGTFDIEGDVSMDPVTSATATIDNLGLLQRSGGTTPVLLTNVTLNNGGTVDLQSGPLGWTDATAAGVSDGSFLVGEGTNLGVGSGRLTSSAVISGDGNVVFFDGSGPVEIEGGLTVDSLSLASNPVDVLISGSYSVNSTIVVSGGSSLTLSTADTAYSPALAIGGGTVGGTAPLVVSDSLAWFDGSLSGAGALVLTETSYAELTATTTKTSNKPLVVQGTLDILFGTLDQNADLTLDTVAVLQGDGVLDLTDATVLGWYGSTRPGTSPGQLQVVAPSSGLALDPVSVISIEVEGQTPGTGFDVLDFGADVTFDGELDVDTLAGGFVPQAGDRFAVITVDGTRAGDFATVTVPSLAGISLDAVWASGASADTLYLEANGDPLVFSSDRAGIGSLDIWTASADGTSPRQLTASGSDDLGARWSPDGSQILFTRSDGVSGLLWLMDADGSNLVQLSPDQADHDMADWSATGDTIVFATFDGSQQDIWFMLRDGTGLTEITASGVNEFDPTVSPSGSLLLYVSDENGTNDIWLAGFPFGTPQEIPFQGLNYVDANETDPEWSPDNGRIVLVSDQFGSQDIWIANADGTGATRLTSDPGQDWLPVFSADGNRIYFTSDRTGDQELWVMDIDGGNLQQVTDNPAFDGGADAR